MKSKIEKSVFEKFMFPSALWREGYLSYRRQFGNPGFWMILIREGNYKILRLDGKGGPVSGKPRGRESRVLNTFMQKHAEQAVQSKNRKLPEYEFFGKPMNFKGVFIPLRHAGRLKGFIAVYPIKKSLTLSEDLVELFSKFISSQTELAYKNFELNNFYETVHPRALALSTMHSVHRVISSSLRLQDLLPKIGRLCAQVLKARGCSIMLIDPEADYLVPHFSFGTHSQFVHSQRLRIGRGIQGKMAATAEFHLTQRSIGVPFIEDDIVGVIVLWDKIGDQSFTKIDLEILKSVSEQAVVAIKNAQLFEETEQLTLGSIKTINELLELNFGGDRSQLPIFGEIVIEIGKDLELTAKEQLYLERAVILLDTGALALPQKVWHKAGKLTKEEFDEIKGIPARGAHLLRSISSLQPIVPIILHHHERYDGKGYPQGLAGEQIPIGARIVSVVNSFIAMISKRSYRESLTIEEAISEIHSNKSTQFDPRVVESFSKIIRRAEILEKLKKISHRPKKLPA